MKTIEQLMNVDKAKIIFDLFRDEIPEFLEYTQAIAEKVANDKEELLVNWNNPFLSYHQWLQLAERVASAIKKYDKNLTKSGNLFTNQLFDGYLAIFTNHCLEQYGLHRAKSPRFRQAIELFYLPVKLATPTSGQYLVLEMHGGPEYAAICTDTDGNTLVFDDRADAEAEASECQDGLIVEI
ncbi:hypothetical protein [Mucilaginibacter sp. PPCGB 2223]|uniref:hypothetical protein n=1 Tax=Mucilaginibacter sp. PPCGB 2223 TaxID=1886027 RepID=UPI001111B66B|nr:hypothetical protein [Mucilaginibacter sp. PPCGB 2223]